MNGERKNGFPERLRILRKNRGMTQADLASALGLGQTTIANYEQGSRFPDERILFQMADIFLTSLDYLMGRTDYNPGGGDTGFGSDIPGIMPALDPEVLKKRFLDYLLSRGKEEAGKLILKSLSHGLPLSSIYLKVLEKALKDVGDMWEKNLIDIEQEHYISEATIQIMARLNHHLVPRTRKDLTFVGLITSGERHNIGMRMLTDLFELDGWKVYNFGTDLPLRNIRKALSMFSADVCGISVTLNEHLNGAASLIQGIKSDPALRNVKILVGGSAFSGNDEEWKTLGAHGYAPDALSAVQLADKLMGKTVLSC
jgi:methanogenic corrinoid protein MtbC1